MSKDKRLSLSPMPDEGGGEVEEGTFVSICFSDIIITVPKKLSI